MEVMLEEQPQQRWRTTVHGVSTASHIESAIRLWWHSSVNGQPEGNLEDALLLHLPEGSVPSLQLQNMNRVDHPFFIFYDYNESARQLYIVGSCNYDELSDVLTTKAFSDCLQKHLPIHKHIKLYIESFPFLKQSSEHWVAFTCSQMSESDDIVTLAACETRIEALYKIYTLFKNPGSGRIAVHKFLEARHDSYFDLSCKQGRCNDVGSHLICLTLIYEHPELKEVFLIAERELIRFRMMYYYGNEAETFRVLLNNGVDVSERLIKTVPEASRHLFRCKYNCAALPYAWLRLPFQDVHGFQKWHFILQRGSLYLSYKDVWRWIWKNCERKMLQLLDHKQALQHSLSENAALYSIFGAVGRKYRSMKCGRSGGGYRNKFPIAGDIEDIAANYMPPCMANLVRIAAGGRHLRYSERTTFFPFLVTAGYSRDDVRRHALQLWQRDPENAGRGVSAFETDCGKEIDWVCRNKTMCSGCEKMKDYALQNQTYDSGCPFVRYKKDERKLRELLLFCKLSDDAASTIISRLHHKENGGAAAACLKCFELRHGRAISNIKNPILYFSKAV